MTHFAASCPSCGFRSDRVPAAAAGRNVRCPRCRTTFRAEPPGPVPTRFEEAPATTPESPPLTTPEEPLPAAPARAETGSTLRAPSSAEWKVGDVVLGLYEVTAVLGQGGMGRVYKVRHRGWDLDLAVKTPLPQILEAAGGAQAFEREAETWVGLGLHPHIVTCHYVRQIQGIPRVFAEYVDGGSLLDAVRGGRLASLAALLDAAIQFAWGLDYAHEQGLVHRDVKPGNVMATIDGVLKVTDFGLARAGRLEASAPTLAAASGSEGATLMVAGGAAGTLAYMSPEQARGGVLTRRADLWSWALSVLEMFAGGRGWEYGPAAAEALEDYLSGGSLRPGLPRMPGPVAELLRRSFRDAESERPHDLAEAAAILVECYASAVGQAYPRDRPKAGRGTADSLNNSAVSLLDLDREEDAKELWEKALAAEPQHLESTYNRALHEWAHGRLDDGELLRRFDEALKSHPSEARAQHLSARLCLGLGQFARALGALDEAARLGAKEADLQRDRALGLAGHAAAGEDKEAWGRVKDAFARALDLGDADAADVAGHALALGRMGDEGAATTFYRDARSRRSDLPEDMGVAFRTLVPGQERMSSLKGLTGAATALAVTPDGSQVIAGGGGREARVWAADTGAALRKLLSDDGRLRALAVTPEGRYLVWAAEEAPLRVFDLTQGRSVRSWTRTSGSPTSLALSPDGRLAVAGFSDRAVRIFDLVSGHCAHVLEGHDDAVAAVAVGPTRIVSGSRDGTVRVWDAATGRALAVHRGHTGRVNAVALDEARRRIASGGEDKSLRLWPWDGHGTESVFLGPTQAVSAIAFGAGGRVLVAGSLDRTVRLLDLESGTLRSLVRLDAAIHAIVAQDDALFVGHGSTVSRLGVPERPRVPALALSRPLSAVEAQSRDAEFEARLRDARRHLEVGDLDQALDAAQAAREITGYERAPAGLLVWDTLVAKLPRTGLRAAWEERVLTGHTDQVLAVAVSMGGFVASGGTDKSIRLADPARSDAPRVLEGHEGPVAALAFSPDGRRLWSGSWDQTLRGWDAEGGRAVATFRGHTEYVVAVALSPDGRLIASGALDHAVRLWRPDGTVVGVLAGHSAPVAAVAFSPDGKVVVSGSWDQTLRVWDSGAGAALFALEGHSCNVTAVTLAPRAPTAASGGADGSVRLWDLRGRRETHALKGHTSEVTSVAFTPDGRFLASASRDGTVRLWDVATASAVRALKHPSAVLAAALGRAGTLLVSGGADRAVRTWRLDWQPERPEARLRLKPETVRIAAPAPSEPGASIPPGRLPERPRPAAQEWEDLRKDAAKTILRRPSRPRQPLPWRAIRLVALVLATAVVSFTAWRLSRPKLHLVGPIVRTLRAGPDLISLGAYSDPCDAGGYEAYLERVRAPEVSAPDLACLASFRDPGTVSTYLETVPIEEGDALRSKRLFRDAVSLMVGLGDAGVGPLCSYLGADRDDSRRVASLALAVQESAAARTCLLTSMKSGDTSTARAAAVSTLPRLLARGSLGLDEGFTLARDLVHDRDPAVRRAALKALVIFSEAFSRPLAEGAASDPDPGVRASAEEALKDIADARRGEALEGQ